MLRNVPIFRGLNAKCILEIVNRMTSIVALPGDLIVTKGHSNSGLYFISRGEVEVIVHDDEEEEDKEPETARPKSSSPKATTLAKSRYS